MSHQCHISLTEMNPKENEMKNGNMVVEDEDQQDQEEFCREDEEEEGVVSEVVKETNNHNHSSTSSSKYMIESRDKGFSVLSFEQVRRLNALMSTVIPIGGRGNFPTLDVQLSDLVFKVKNKLATQYSIPVKEIRLNGSGASSVLANEHLSYNDLDLIFSVSLPNRVAFDHVKMAVLDVLLELLPEGVSRQRMSSCSMKEAYVSKMVKVYESDKWSLISLGNNRSVATVELKFVDSMRRQYEFSVDSFHIILDSLFDFYSIAPQNLMGETFYPTVLAESKYKDFEAALFHLSNKLIATRNPEEIRGGGLLKYCNLLVRHYRSGNPSSEVKVMERYMCSRFFIDFPDIGTQRAKLNNYLWNHFSSSEDPRLKYDYLMILFSVVNESTVCLMNHERRLTLNLIEELALTYYSRLVSLDYLTNTEVSEVDEFSSVSSSSSSSCSSSSSLCPSPIPTYEIVTSGTPTMYYSHTGYYFVSSSSSSSSSSNSSSSSSNSSSSSSNSSYLPSAFSPSSCSIVSWNNYKLCKGGTVVS